HASVSFSFQGTLIITVNRRLVHFIIINLTLSTPFLSGCAVSSTTYFYQFVSFHRRHMKIYHVYF
ncbi:hypothetical protein ACT3HK_15125, partial [Thermolongibacillus altinsuensis]